MKHKKRTTEIDDITINHTHKTVYTQLESMDKNVKMPNMLTHLPKGKPVKK